MKLRMLLACLALAATLSASAGKIPAHDEADFSWRWVSTPMKKAKGPNGEVRMKILERGVWFGNGTGYTVGNITYLSSPKKKGAKPEDYAIEPIVKDLGKPMKIQDWKHRKQGGADVYEGYYEEGNRLIRLYFDQNDERFNVSIGVFRMAYIDGMVIESELIQRELHHADTEKHPWLRWMMSSTDLVVPEAQAEPCPPCPPSPSPWAAMACATCATNQLTTQMGNLNTTLGQTNAQAAVANGNWANSNNNWANTNGQLGAANAQLGAANQNWANTNGQLAGANANWAQTNQQLQGFNDNWKRSNDLLEKAMSPTNAFVLGLATGAGAAAGAALIGVLTTGLTDLASAIFEAVTHEKRDAKLLANFDKAVDTYNKLAPEMRKTEAYIDSTLSALKMIKDAGGKQALITHFNERIRRAETLSQRARELELNVERAGGNIEAACRDQLTREGARFDALIRQMTALRTKVEQTSEDSACAELDEQMRSIIEAEGALAMARARIVQPLTQEVVGQAYAKQRSEYMQLIAQASDPNEMESLHQSTLKIARQQLARDIAARPQLGRQIQDAYDRCIHDLTYQASGATGFFAQWPIIGQAVRAGVTVHLDNGRTQGLLPFCRERANDPSSRWASGYSSLLRTLQESAGVNKTLADVTADFNRKHPNLVPQVTALDAANGARQDFFANQRLILSRPHLSEDRTTELMQKQGDLRALCPNIPHGLATTD